MAIIFKIKLHELFMPEYDLSPSPVAKDILFRYTEEIEESIHAVLGELKDRYSGPTAKGGPAEAAEP